MSATVHTGGGSGRNTGAEGGDRPTISGVVLGPFETNCYVVRFPASRACWIVDAGYQPAELIDLVKRERLEPSALVLTHAHCDHMAGAAEVVRAFPGIPIWVHSAEEHWLSDPLLNLSAMTGIEATAPAASRLLEDGQTLDLAGHPWRVLHTPGHSPGGITLVHDASRTAIVGDALFAGSIGRTDFPGSDFETLARSIRTRLYTLPDDTTIYPGHGPSSTIGREQRTNPFVRP